MAGSLNPGEALGSHQGMASPACERLHRTMGFAAFGRIARVLAEQTSGFGMTLLACDPYLDGETMDRYGAEEVELHELLRRADVIVVHGPINDETLHLLDAREFSLMKEVCLAGESRHCDHFPRVLMAVWPLPESE